MEPQSSAQTEQTTAEQGGVEKRIGELTAARRQAEEALAATQKQVMEQAAQMAQMAIAQRQAVAPPPPEIDPLAQFKDNLDPTAHAAIQAAVAATQKRIEAQYAPMFAQQAAQIAGFAVQAEAATIKGLPVEVTNRAAQLAAQWRNQGMNFPPGDAINFALGEYQRGQLLKAAPVVGYNPATAGVLPGNPGFVPPPAATRPNALPSNFETLNRTQQLAALDASGVGDEPL